MPVTALSAFQRMTLLEHEQPGLRERAEKLLGWKAKVGFEEGLRRTIEWYRAHRASQGAAS